MKALSCLVALLIVLFISPAYAESAKNKHIVLVDPSHGGSDPGVQLTEKIQEKDVTLSVALLIQKDFQKTDRVQLQLTRSSDTTVSSADRINLIKTLRPDALIILHVNAGFGKTSTGYEVYFAGFKPSSSERGEAKVIVKDMAKNKFLNDSVKLAHQIGKNLASVFPRKDRGLREAPIPAMEGLAIPAVVVEMGFATNPEDKKMLVDEATRQSIARALAKSIRESF